MQAVLSKTTSDQIKSKILSTEVSQLVFDVYISPLEFAQLIETFNEQQFELSIVDHIDQKDLP